MMMNPKSKEEK